MPTTEEEKYNIFVPVDVFDSVSKSEQAEDGEWYVRGFAATPDLDMQGDIVLPEGIDIGYFSTKGFINYEHKQDAEYIIGVPTDNCYVDLEKGLFVEARLMKENKYAQSMWSLANMIKKSGIDRNLGFSIEGAVKSRSDYDKRVIEGVMVKNVALTTHPANPNATWETLVKAWETGYATTPDEQTGAAAFRKEHLAPEVTNLTNAVRTISKLNVMPKEDKDYVIKEAAKSFDNEPSLDVSAVMLQLSRGISFNQAQDFIVRSRKEKNE